MSYQEKWRVRPPTLSHRGVPAAEVPVGESLPQRGPLIHNAWRPFEDVYRPNILASFHVRSPDAAPPVPIALVPAPGLTEEQLAELAAARLAAGGRPRADLAPNLAPERGASFHAPNLTPGQRADICARALAGESTFKLAREIGFLSHAGVERIVAGHNSSPEPDEAP